MRFALLLLPLAMALMAPVRSYAVPSFGDFNVSEQPPAHSEETTAPDGGRVVCENGVCRIVYDDEAEDAKSVAAGAVPEKATRMILGTRSVDEFIAFLDNAEPGGKGGAFESFTWLTLLLAILGGIALNLTPCVLPMIPVNLIIIGKSPLRGAVYGLGMAVAYGLLGLLASFGLLAFGSIQSSPWFNAFVAVVFVVLALSMLGFFSIDLSRYRPGTVNPEQSRASLVVPFFLGSLSAILAGACVAPILISVIVLTARLSAEGNYFVLALPFALGVGMALPWPFLGAGMKVLPKPGAWMKYVNKAFGVLILLFAVWYGYLAVSGWTSRAPEAQSAGGSALEAVPATFESAFAEAKKSGKPVFVDCWATWCKNCTAMEKTTLADERVVKALERFEVIRLDATEIGEFKKIAPFRDVQGLPAYAVFE